MMTYYRLRENGEILDFANWKYAEDCIETEREIKTINGIAHFTDEENYQTLLNQFTQKQQALEQIKALKEELVKAKEDVEQVELFGMERSDYATKKERCKQIVLTLRELEKEV